jgi:hypothetical protein
LGADLREHLAGEAVRVASFSYQAADRGEALFPVARVVHEPIFFDSRRYALLQPVPPGEFLIVMKRNSEPSRDYDARQARGHQLSEVSGLGPETACVARPLFAQVGEPFVAQVSGRRNGVGALDPLALPLADLARVGRLQAVAVLRDFEPHVLAFELLEQRVGVLD